MTNLDELRKKAEAVSDDDWEGECFYFEDMTTPEIADLLSVVTPSAVLDLIAEIERLRESERWHKTALRIFNDPEIKEAKSW